MNNIINIYIVSVSDNEIIFIKLTVTYNSPDCLHNARSRKESKEICQHALSDLETKGMISELIVLSRFFYFLSCSFCP